MLYRKEIEQLTWDDVEAFCALCSKENFVLDYKAEISNALPKTVAAMANTLGGHILIGVGEDGDNRPITPIAGIPYRTHLEDQVINLCLSNITPPVMPELIALRHQNQAALVIRVAQSIETPHAINQNRSVYLRTGSVSTPEELATVDEIEWLVGKRKKSIELREQLLTRADARFRAIAASCINNPRYAPLNPVLSLRMGPYFPQHSLVSPPRLYEILAGLYAPTVPDYPLSFPPRGGIPRYHQDGAWLGDIHEQVGARVFQGTRFGWCVYMQTLFPDETAPDIPASVIGGEVAARVAQFVFVAHDLLSALAYHGPVRFEFEVGNLVGVPIFLWSRQGEVPKQCPDEKVLFSRDLPFSRNVPVLTETVTDCIRHLYWAFGRDFSGDILAWLRASGFPVA